MSSRKQDGGNYENSTAVSGLSSMTWLRILDRITELWLMFFADRPEHPILLPDRAGSVIKQCSIQ